MNILKISNLIISITNFTIFIWGVWGIFIKKGNSSQGLNVIKIASPSCIIAVVYVLAISNEIYGIRAITSIILLISSFILFWYCSYVNWNNKLSLAYSFDLPEHIMKKGPYKFIRHPFYTSYIISYFAGLVASKNPLLIPVVLLMFGIYYDAARKEEKKFAISNLSNEYEKYKKETGMFLPKIIKRHKQEENYV